NTAYMQLSSLTTED
nr:immunoglobulin heavy chain junction region [Mus musculus]